MAKKDKGVPPINFLRFFIKGRCPYCKKSETEFYDEGKNPEESKKLRESNKIKPLWVCILRPDIAKGHIACTQENWQICPLRR